MNWHQVFCPHDWQDVGMEYRPTGSGNFVRGWKQQECSECGKMREYPTASVHRNMREALEHDRIEQ
jgi:hypothetical protein